MKILVVGVHFYSSFAWSIEQALNRAGHTTVLFDYRKNSLLRLPILKKVLSQVIMQQRLIQTVKNEKPDLIFICKGELIKHQTIHEIKNIRPVKIINWFPDPRLYSFSDIFTSLPLLDGFFTKNVDDVERARLLGIKNIHLLHHCADIELHASPKVDNNRMFDSLVAFIGSYYPYRDVILGKLIDFNLKIWGGGWEHSQLCQKIPDAVTGKEARDLEQANIFYNSTINLNTHHYDDNNAINQRVFDICGSGGFQLVDYKQAVKQCFEIGKDLDTFNSLEELKEKISYYIEQPNEAKVIAQRAHKKTLQSHTYDHRIEEIFDTVKLS